MRSTGEQMKDPLRDLYMSVARQAWAHKEADIETLVNEKIVIPENKMRVALGKERLKDYQIDLIFSEVLTATIVLDRLNRLSVWCRKNPEASYVDYKRIFGVPDQHWKEHIEKYELHMAGPSPIDLLDSSEKAIISDQMDPDRDRGSGNSMKSRSGAKLPL